MSIATWTRRARSSLSNGRRSVSTKSGPHDFSEQLQLLGDGQNGGTFMKLPQERNPVELEFHDTPRLWVAYRGCGCEECPKGFGKTKEEAVADLEESTATNGSPS
jgi:hypothetical protein